MAIRFTTAATALLVLFSKKSNSSVTGCWYFFSVFMERIGRKIKSGFVQFASFKIMVDLSYALHTNKVKN